MKSEFEKWYSNSKDKSASSAFAAGWMCQQSKVDELQKKNAWLSDVAERENKRANKLQEEKVSTTTLLGKTIQEKNELQKRVDALNSLIQSHLHELHECYESDKENKFEYWRGFSHSAGTSAKRLEQALKGGEA